jgi:hypothetical protein
MTALIKSVAYALALFGLLSAPLAAQEQDLAPVPASEVVLADLLYLKRLVVIFADSPNDPTYQRQLELLATNPGDLIDRDVLLVIDTAPETPSDLRKELRPRGFSLVILDKDGKVAIRKPLPWDTREISRAIDKFPSRRVEVLERNPAGR